MKYQVNSVEITNDITSFVTLDEDVIVVNIKDIKKIEFISNFMVVTVIDEDLRQLREDCYERIKECSYKIEDWTEQFDEELISAVEFQKYILEQAIAMENIIEMYHLRELDEMFADNEDGKE